MQLRLVILRVILKSSHHWASAASDTSPSCPFSDVVRFWTASSSFTTVLPATTDEGMSYSYAWSPYG